MANTTAKIRAAASRNADLLSTLATTDHAIPDLANQDRYITDLEAQVAAAKQRLASLARRREKELHEHEKYRDSVMRRFAAKVSGKKAEFAERAAKEEQDYFAVLQEEQREGAVKGNLEGMLSQAEQVRASLQAAAEKHRQAQEDLDRLYNEIFEGPSPGFPDEDAREQEAKSSRSAYHEARMRADGEGQAVRILHQARRCMQGAQMSMEEARSASRRDMFGGGTFTDMMERNALSMAERQVAEARILVMQAGRMSQEVRELPPVTIAQGHLMSDVFFDNIFTDMAFHDQIKASMVEVANCAQFLEGQIYAAGGRHADKRREVGEREKALENARTALQKARESAFEVTVGPPTAPPAYYDDS